MSERLNLVLNSVEITEIQSEHQIFRREDPGYVHAEIRECRKEVMYKYITPFSL